MTSSPPTARWPTSARAVSSVSKARITSSATARSATSASTSRANQSPAHKGEGNLAEDGAGDGFEGAAETADDRGDVGVGSFHREDAAGGDDEAAAFGLRERVFGLCDGRFGCSVA